MTPQRIPTFLHIPKTGGTTISYLLRRSFGIRHVDVDPLAGHNQEIRPEDLVLARRTHPFGIASLAGHGFRPGIDLSSSGIHPEFYTLFRDPVALSISWYVYRIMKRNRELQDPMTYFSRKAPQNFQVRRLAGEPNLDKAIDVLESTFRFAGLLERFDESLRLLRESFPDWGVDIRYRVQNVGGDNSLKRELKENASLMELLEETNELDRALCEHVEKRFFPDKEDAAKEKESLVLESALPSCRVGANRLARNLIYKPAVAVTRYCSPR